jgi:hypothetical protein
MSKIFDLPQLFRKSFAQFYFVRALMLLLPLTFLSPAAKAGEPGPPYGDIECKSDSKDYKMSLYLHIASDGNHVFSLAESGSKGMEYDLGLTEDDGHWNKFLNHQIYSRKISINFILESDDGMITAFIHGEQIKGNPFDVHFYAIPATIRDAKECSDKDPELIGCKQFDAKLFYSARGGYYDLHCTLVEKQKNWSL